MKMLTVVLAICMLNIISCSNDNDAEIAELKNQIQELQQAQTAVVATTPSPATVTSTPISLPELGVKVEYSDKVKLCLDDIRNASKTNTNLMPLIINAALEYATLGEIVDSMKDVFGEWQENSII